MSKRSRKGSEIGRSEQTAQRSANGWVTYSRCFLLTLGGLFIGLVIIAFITDGDVPEDFPWWGYLLAGSLVAIGATLLLIGLLGSRKTADKYANDSSTHEASLVVMILAAPLYWLLKALEKHKIRSHD